MSSTTDLSEYKWTGNPSLAKTTPWSDHCRRFLDSINWTDLGEYASKLRGGKKCQIEDLIGLGGRHIVRILTFTDGRRFVARLRIPSISDPEGKEGDTEESLMLREADCLRLVGSQTSVPVPQILGVGRRDTGFGTGFILMDCLPGNVGMDINFNFIPKQFKGRFFEQMANAQVQTCNLLFPQIGSLVLLRDGAVKIGPIPGIGGPFDTASAYLRAWASNKKFAASEQRVREVCGSLFDEIWDSIVAFPERIMTLASQITKAHEHGLFPLVHVDFGHNNIVVDPEYNILGVIDWEHAATLPWETVDFPLTVRKTPKPMDASWNYNADGSPKDEDLIAKYNDREQYLMAVKTAEANLGSSSLLSDVLGDEKIQDLAAAMRLFATDGKMGWYARVLDAYESGV